VVAMTPKDLDEFVTKTYHTNGVIEEYPKLTLTECLEQDLIATYVGLCQWEDRADEEPYRFLVDTKEQNNSILRWNPDPSTPKSKITLEEAKHLLGFKPVFVYKKALEDGFEAYMVERSLARQQADLELGLQRLNRVAGAGSNFHGQAGVFHVFITYALKKHLRQFPYLAVVPNKQKHE